MAFEVVCCIALGGSTVYNQLMPIAKHPSVSKIWIIRAKKCAYGNIPKAEHIIIPNRFKLWRLLLMLKACLKLGRSKDVKAYISFNPIPYGLISLIAAKFNKKPIHLGFIGSDWNLYTKGKWRMLLIALFKRANFITAPGPKMKNEMISLGLDANRISILPHCVDLNRFTVAEQDSKRYTCIFVGNLIGIKRVNVILQGFALVLTTHPDARLCIVGDGPLADKLKTEALELNISDNVDFTGFVPDVQSYLADSKIVIIASEHEGLPFALIEGMCTGLIPISTPVGTIPELIIDGENGLLFPQNDSTALARCINRLLDDEQFYLRMREKTLQMRTHFAYDKATNVWDKWLTSPQRKTVSPHKAERQSQ